MTEINRIDRVQQPAANQPPASRTERSPRFQELLDRLQQLADDQAAAKAVDNPESLREALRTADDGFVAAMDLRKQLEEAFKKHMP